MDPAIFAGRIRILPEPQNASWKGRHERIFHIVALGGGHEASMAIPDREIRRCKSCSDSETKPRLSIPGWGALDSFFLGAFGATIITSGMALFASGSSAMGRLHYLEALQLGC